MLLYADRDGPAHGSGLTVSHVESGGQAAEAGLVVGDKVIAVLGIGLSQNISATQMIKPLPKDAQVRR